MKGLVLLAFKSNRLLGYAILAYIPLGTLMALSDTGNQSVSWILMLALGQSFLVQFMFTPGAATGSSESRKWDERAFPATRRNFGTSRYLMAGGVALLWVVLSGSLLWAFGRVSVVWAGALLVYGVLVPLILMPLEFFSLGDSGKVYLSRILLLPLVMIPALSPLAAGKMPSFARSWPSYGELLGNFWNLLGLGWLGVVPVLGLASWFLSQLILDRREQ